MSSQSTATASSSTGRDGSSGLRRSRRLANMIMDINQEEVDDGISKKKQKPKPPMELAFENDLVLLKIFRHSSPSDLKGFRLVNRKWNDTATSTLLIRRSLELKLSTFCKQDRDRSDPKTSGPSKPSQVKFQKGSRGSWTDLCGLIKSSEKFPTRSLTFDQENAELVPQVQELLNTFKNQFKELSFYGDCKVSRSFLREVLLDLVPNLESLIINGSALVEKKEPVSTTDSGGDHSFEFDRLLSLPHLKELHFWPYEKIFNLAKPNSNYSLQVEFFKEIINAAVNLQSVDPLPLDFLEVLLDAGKVQLVKKLDFRPTREAVERLGGAVQVSYLAVYQKLASMKSEIKTLKMQSLEVLDRDRPSRLKKTMFESALNSILESSKDSLRNFHIEMLPGFLIDLPVFPNLRKLNIEIWSEVKEDFSDGVSTYNPAFSLQRNFPHLHEVDLWLCSYIDFDIKYLFRGNLEKWVNPTVKHLQFGGNMSYRDEGEIDSPYEGPQTLGKMFPNATSVVIDYDHDNNAQELSSIIWHQIPAGVKRLSVTNLDARDPLQDIVDIFFTGMPIKICRRLRKWPQRMCMDKDAVDAFRTEPSICVFKNLEELNICCSDLRSDQPFASHVTGLYAFDLMPQLIVTVTYEPRPDSSRKHTTPSQDMEGALKHIAPYITQVCCATTYD